MTSPIGNQHNTGMVHRTSRPEAPSEAEFPGKSAESVGHLAKASVLEAGDSEPGAQGRAASRIARMDVTVLAPTDSGDEQVSDTAGDGDGAVDPDAGENILE
ncbi:MAG: hypothetical protein EOQ52_12525 [Mesorhizobium sp.]|nr:MULTISPECIES: hypothetical protein [unclassified Mesorhizobium]PBB85699.1 hypothetical protein CK216_16355 [Mesorhizobium sp. WSM3876]TGT60047.1 hypothetical protein EN813_026095 [Mesorhizobium sp. M00.F.Ca.ET.170.01.1.1]RWB89199.1 MAG: hypothetical protein EOQ52_12525 [Mesorhizobium sp.]RWE37637.1 MAG: hypothetical protein EOS77_01930 [Mesorhizobium sp.]TGS65456.1 hypothetical protein EN844_18795 [Mesorhizobium sp. M3A.F.Ca.ET.201.01.1.1]